MKPDYKNWMPKGMIYAFLAAFLGCAAALAVFSLVLTEGTIKTVLTIVFAVLTLLFCVSTKWSVLMYRAFDYNGKRKMAKQIIDGTAAYVKLPEGGKCLDVGCGSGALSIAVAKRNPKAEVIGIDRWGREYASFSKTLCENNAKAEGVKRSLSGREMQPIWILRTRHLTLYAAIMCITTSPETGRLICWKHSGH